MKRVMHEFKHGQLKSGSGDTVESRDQAIAIGLKESGTSKYESGSENASNYEHTKEKESAGETAQQEREGHM